MESEQQREERRNRLNLVEANAKARVNEVKAPQRDEKWFARNVFIPQEPIIIGTSEDIGTARARANHLSSVIDYFEEQKILKDAGAPIPDCRKQTRIT